MNDINNYKSIITDFIKHSLRILDKYIRYLKTQERSDFITQEFEKEVTSINNGFFKKCCEFLDLNSTPIIELANQKIRLIRKLDKPVKLLTKKKCTKCKKILSVKLFHKNSSNRTGITTQCKKCLKKNILKKCLKK